MLSIEIYSLTCTLGIILKSNSIRRTSRGRLLAKAKSPSLKARWVFWEDSCNWVQKLPWSKLTEKGNWITLTENKSWSYVSYFLFQLLILKIYHFGARPLSFRQRYEPTSYWQRDWNSSKKALKSRVNWTNSKIQAVVSFWMSDKV